MNTQKQIISQAIGEMEKEIAEQGCKMVACNVYMDGEKVIKRAIMCNGRLHKTEGAGADIIMPCDCKNKKRGWF